MHQPDLFLVDQVFFRRYAIITIAVNVGIIIADIVGEGTLAFFPPYIINNPEIENLEQICFQRENAFEVANGLSVQQLDPEIIHDGGGTTIITEGMKPLAGVSHEKWVVFVIDRKDGLIITRSQFLTGFLCQH